MIILSHTQRYVLRLDRSIQMNFAVKPSIDSYDLDAAVKPQHVAVNCGANFIQPLALRKTNSIKE